MRRVFFSSIGFGVFVLMGCAEQLPEMVPLTPGAEQVEIVSETPAGDVYAPVGALSARVAGNEAQSATREARNELRNQAARKGATVVTIDEVSTNNSMTARGRTVVSITGTAYKPK